MKKKFFILLAGLLSVLFGQSQVNSQKTRLSGDLEIIALSANAYLYVSYVHSETFGRYGDNGLIYINNNEAIFIDAPTTDSISNILLLWLTKTFPGVIVKAVIPTHFHGDCLGGLRAFHKAGVPSYANKMTAQLIKEDSVEKPQNGFSKTLILRAGNDKVICHYFGEGHSKDNIVVYIPAQKILFGGCLIKSLGANQGYIGDANLQQWSKTVKQVKSEYGQATIVIPGHGNHGNTELLDYTIKLFELPAQ